MLHITKEGARSVKYLQRAVLTVLIAALLMSAVSVFLPKAAAYETKYGIIVNVTSNLNVRSGPGTSNSVLGALYGGDKVVIVGEEPDSNGDIWYKIEYSSGYGYIHSDYVRLYTPAQGGDMTDEEFRAQLEAQGFPESYIEKIMEVHAVYPNWVFKAMITGYEWDYVIAKEYRLGYSLVENSFPSSWKSTQPGAYNWETGEWYGFDGARWVCASEEIIKYYMDPRNFMDTDTVFQFLDQSYDENVQTVEGVQALLNGSFMEGVLPDDTSKTYAEVIYDAAKANGLNPYVIAAMLLTEQGKNGSSLSDGNYPGYEGYYNFFNIQASASGTETAVQRGLAYAVKCGWNTRTKSINGGTEIYANSFFKAGQTTLYLKRFNVQGSKPFEYQYMTSIYGAKVEGEVMARGYSEETRQAALTFLIPVYEDMPSTPCAQPTGDGSPNIKLKSLSVEGFELTPDFQPDIMEYSLVVPHDTASVNIKAASMDSKATVTGGGTLTLDSTVNKFTVTVTAENKDTRDYVITVAKESPGIEGIEFSGKYATSGVYVLIGPDVPASTVASDLLTNGKVIITHNDGASKDETAVICTGDKILLYDKNDESVAVYTAAVKGDVNGDGTVSGSDFIKIRNHILGSTILKGDSFTAADVNRDGAVSGSDFIKVRNHILKTNLLA